MLDNKQVVLMDCPKITGAGVQWLVAGCPVMSTLNLKGTKATLTTLNIVKERYPYSRIKASTAITTRISSTHNACRLTMSGEGTDAHRPDRRCSVPSLHQECLIVDGSAVYACENPSEWYAGGVSGRRAHLKKVRICMR